MLSCAITAEVGASLAMQAAVEHPWWYLVVVLGYGVGFALLVRILKSGTAVGVAYGIWVTLTADSGVD
uniref:SMR family transporter n=1 Tax=Mycolicibacterium iranicum TaxID=912594 RepID=UPI003F584B33